MKNVTSYGVRIYIEDKNLVCSRPVIENQLLETTLRCQNRKRMNNTYPVFTVFLLAKTILLRKIFPKTVFVTKTDF